MKIAVLLTLWTGVACAMPAPTGDDEFGHGWVGFPCMIRGTWEPWWPDLIEPQPPAEDCNDDTQ